MYTIGQVANFLGVSRDTLKYYEEKDLVRPKQDDENGYRKYDHFDIYDVITTNFYRELDIEVKKIQEIRKKISVEGVKFILEEKEQLILEEIKYKQQLLKQIEYVKEDCEKIKQYLGKFVIKEMKPIEVKGEITNITAYDEYDVIQQHTKKTKKAITLTGLRRVITFNDKGMIGDQFIVVRKVEETDLDIKGVVLAHPRCIYTVIENGRYINGGKNIDHEVEESLRKITIEKGYIPLGMTYINLLLTTYEEGLERIFLEIYTPIK